MQRRSFVRSVGALAAVGGLGGLTWLGRTDAEQRLELAMARWVAAGVDTYVMSYTSHCVCGPFPDVICACAPPSRSWVEVVDGEPRKAGAYESNRAVPWFTGPTVPLFFDTLVATVDAGEAFRASYHRQLGYPVELSAPSRFLTDIVVEI